MATVAAVHRESERSEGGAPQDEAVVSLESTARPWTEYILRHPDATGYHDWAWRDVFERAFGCPSMYFAARRDRRIVGVLPTVLLDSWLFGRSLVSLPFLN
jgi:serine/alanine adding enzyme